MSDPAAGFSRRLEVRFAPDKWGKRRAYSWNKCKADWERIAISAAEHWLASGFAEPAVEHALAAGAETCRSVQ